MTSLGAIIHPTTAPTETLFVLFCIGPESRPCTGRYMPKKCLTLGEGILNYCLLQSGNHVCERTLM